MTSGIFTETANLVRCYTRPTTCHHRKKPWLRMKLPQRSAKQKWKEMVERIGREREREVTKTQFDSCTQPCQTVLTGIHSRLFSLSVTEFFSPKANVSIFCSCISPYATRSPVEYLKQGFILLLTECVFILQCYFPMIDSIIQAFFHFISLFHLLLKTNTNKDNLTPLSSVQQ